MAAMCPPATGRARAIRTGEIRENRRLCDEHYLLRLAMEDFPPTRPGQFVQLQCRPLREQMVARQVDWPAGAPPRLTQPELTDREPFLRRPFSIAGRRDKGRRCELEIIYRTVGAGTGWLSKAAAGQPLSVIGPLGNAFAVPDGKGLAVLVGGGVGIPPMLYLAEALAAAGRRVVAFNGARAGRLLPLTLSTDVAASPTGEPNGCVEEFAARGAAAAVCTDDGSVGFRGFAAEAFARWLARSSAAVGELAVYSCGPEAMMRQVGEACIRRGVFCQLALERYMGCGLGTCQSCVFKMRADNEQGWVYKLVCADGPVFDADQIVWE